MLTLYTFNLKDLNSHLTIILQNDFQNPKLSLFTIFINIIVIVDLLASTLKVSVLVLYHQILISCVCNISCHAGATI